ncbi:MAG: hypothetical protein KDJ77_03455, partial [Rhodobiaceae bacterium]|nr:hypothetical protein [Rhodobiaceae bacterium]
GTNDFSIFSTPDQYGPYLHYASDAESGSDRYGSVKCLYTRGDLPEDVVALLDALVTGATAKPDWCAGVYDARPDEAAPEGTAATTGEAQPAGSATTTEGAEAKTPPETSVKDRAWCGDDIPADARAALSKLYSERE